MTILGSSAKKDFRPMLAGLSFAQTTGATPKSVADNSNKVIKTPLKIPPKSVGKTTPTPMPQTTKKEETPQDLQKRPLVIAEGPNTAFFSYFAKNKYAYVTKPSYVSAGIKYVGFDFPKISPKLLESFGASDKYLLARQASLYRQNFEAVKKCYEDNFIRLEDVSVADGKLRQCVDNEEIKDYKRRFFYNQTFYEDSVRSLLQARDTISWNIEKSVDRKMKDANHADILVKRDVPEMAEQGLRLGAIVQSQVSEPAKIFNQTLIQKNQDTLLEIGKQQAAAETSTFSGWLSNLFTSQSTIEFNKTQALIQEQKKSENVHHEQILRDFMNDKHYADDGTFVQFSE